MKKKCSYIKLNYNVILFLILFSATIFSKGNNYSLLDYQFFTAKYFKINKKLNLFYSADERKLGEILKDSIIARYGETKNKKMYKRIKRVGNFIIKHLPYTEKRIDFTFIIIQTNTLQTLSFPGGFIVFTEGMMNFLKNDDELGCMLDHEIAHIENKDNVSLLYYLKVFRSFKKVMYNDQYNYEYVKRKILHMYLDYRKEIKIEYRTDRDAAKLSLGLGFKIESMLDIMTRVINDKDLRFQFHYYHNGTNRIWKLKYFIEHIDRKKWERILLK